MGERSRLRPQQGAGARGGAGAGSLVMAALTLALVGLVLGLALVPWSRDTAAPPPDTPPAPPPDTVAACGDNEECARVAEVMDTRHGRTRLYLDLPHVMHKFTKYHYDIMAIIMKI